MNVIITDAAMDDIGDIYNYIYYNLQNPISAESFIEKIFNSCNRLSTMPNIGFSLQAKTGIETDYRCLVCGNYIAFYIIENQTVRIERILDGRTEYMKIIF